MVSQSPKQAQAQPMTAEKTVAAPKSAEPRTLPQFKVILHNDDENDIEHVVQSVVMLTPLKAEAAVQRTLEAHYTGCALLLVTHKERAELYVDQFASRNLTVSIEPAD